MLFYVIVYICWPNVCHATDQAQEYLGKPSNENKAVEFRLESSDSMVSSSKFRKVFREWIGCCFQYVFDTCQNFTMACV